MPDSDAGTPPDDADLAEMFGLLPDDLLILRALLHQLPGLERVSVFGSRATGRHRSSSDLDLALFGERLGTLAAAEVRERFAASDFVKRVDAVRVHDGLDPILLAEIDRHGVTLSLGNSASPASRVAP